MRFWPMMRPAMENSVVDESVEVGVLLVRAPAVLVQFQLAVGLVGGDVGDQGPADELSLHHAAHAVALLVHRELRPSLKRQRVPSPIQPIQS